MINKNESDKNNGEREMRGGERGRIVSSVSE